MQKIIESIKEKADLIKSTPYSGQKEIYLEHLRQDHRRIVVGNYKIIYLVEKDSIIITDIFDARQSPEKMKV
ncbi:MAG: type II toxin-antitoxin system RelE/ParE family toxin [Chitinophagales bacterium]|nr:type II toxin-antitoxin system RelE/ParE family toxin [Chitinophagales bacterium]